LDRLEQVVSLLAESQLSVEKAVAELATETRRGFDQVAAQFAAVTKRIDEMARENSQRSRESDERVDKLVLAIGELIRNQPPRA
jgi:hypothetical protein